MGLAYLAAYLREQRPGDDIHVLDCLALGGQFVEKSGEFSIRGLPNRLLIDRLRPLRPDLLGISAVGSQSHRIYVETARDLERAFPGVPVLFGGPHATASPERILSECPNSAVVSGEGEITLRCVADDLDAKRTWQRGAGLVVWQNGLLLRNEERPLIADLDSLPLPAFDLFPIEDYFRNQKKWTGFYYRPALNVLSSRGCNMNCAHCAFKDVYRKHTWRPRHPEHIVREIAYLRQTYGVREIHFMDDNLSLSAERLGVLCDLLIESRLGIKWAAPNGLAYWTLDSELLRKMCLSGCYRIALGFESGSKNTLAFIGKPYNREKARTVVQDAKRHGIWTTGYFMLGFPHESEIDMRDTLEFAVELDLDFAAFNAVTPFPGTRLSGVLIDEGIYTKGTLPSIWTYGCNSKYFTRDEIQRVATEFYRKFYRSTLRRLSVSGFRKRIRSVSDISYSGSVLAGYMKIYRHWFLRTCHKAAR